MSKPIKEMIMSVYEQQFEGLTGAVLVNPQQLKATDNHELRHALASKGIEVTLVKNSLAKKAFNGTDMELAAPYLTGPTAVVYPVGEDASVVTAARELIDWAKKMPKLEFRGALLDGITFDADEIKTLSEYPTKEEAQAKIVTLLLSPAQNLASAITSPGKNIAGILKTVQDKLEAGDTIAKVS